jgi:hypothetical protein
MHRSTAVVAVVAVAATTLLVTAGLLGLASAQSDGGAATGAEAPSITVSATGEASAAPDRATVHVSVVAVAETADEARRIAAEDAEGLRSALAEAGVDADAVTTVGYHLGADYRREDPDGYRVTHRFAVDAGVDAAGRVVDAAVAGGAGRVDGVTFSLSDDTRRDLRGDAIAVAMGDARADAEAIATAASVSIEGLHSVSTGGNAYVPVYREAAADADAGTRIDPGPVSVSVSVTVTYAVS